MDPEKVSRVRDWPKPTKGKELQGFLGFANYYRRFVKDFAKKAAPLHVLLRKETEWNWGPDQEKAFRDLKDTFTTEPLLSYPDPSKHFRVEADAPGFATGAVLSMLVI